MPASGTFRQKIAAKHLVEKGGSIAGAMRKAGYSSTTIKNPSKLTSSKAFSDILETIGLSDVRLATLHSELVGASRMDRIVFPHQLEFTKQKGKRKKARTVPFPEKEVRKAIELISGAKLISISRTKYETIATVVVPEHRARSRGIELAYKVKGHLAPDKVEVTQHQMSEEDRNRFGSIFNESKQ